jgi:histidine triad (HIT) family protein
MSFSRKVAIGLREVIPCKRVALTVVGLEVPHAHVHLIPIERMEDVTFLNKVSFSDEEMKEIAHQISNAIKSNT